MKWKVSVEIWKKWIESAIGKYEKWKWKWMKINWKRKECMKIWIFKKIENNNVNNIDIMKSWMKKFESENIKIVKNGKYLLKYEWNINEEHKRSAITKGNVKVKNEWK